MNIALIGICDESLRLVESLVERGHLLTCVAEIPESSLQDREVFALARRLDNWEPLMHDGTADWVVVAGYAREDPEVDRLRKLVQADIGVILIHPGCDAIVCFELDMIRVDTGSPLLAFCPGQDHPVLTQFAELIRDETSSIGVVEQLSFVRFAPDRSRESIAPKLCRDVAKLRRIMGTLESVTASGATYGSDSYANLTLHLESPDSQPAKWSLEPGTNDFSQLTLIGSQGRIRLTIPEGSEPWSLVQLGADEEKQLTVPAHDDVSAILQRMDTASESNWADTCKDADVADTIDISLRRGRRIPLFQETPSQEGTFKGVMAAGGCAILMLVFVTLIIWSMVEGLRYPQNRSSWEDAQQSAKTQAENTAGAESSDPSSQTSLLWRIWPIYPLILFLMLQLLRSVARGDRHRSPPGEPPTEPSGSD